MIQISSLAMEARPSDEIIKVNLQERPDRGRDGGARDEYDVKSGFQPGPRQAPQAAHPPARAVAHDRIADFPACNHTDPRRGIGLWKRPYNHVTSDHFATCVVDGVEIAALDQAIRTTEPVLRAQGHSG